MSISCQKMRDQIYQRYGKDYSCYDHDFFSKCIDHRKEQLSLTSHELYLERILACPEEISLLEACLNNHYSTFFRNPSIFLALENFFLPQLILEKEQMASNEIRIWSMACSYGQEAYSIAMIMDELLKKRKSPLDFRVFCSDRTNSCIEKARTAQYFKDDLQQLSLSRLEQHFDAIDGQYYIKAPLKEKMVYSCFDLLDPHSRAPSECIYHDFDLILCCNVLYYYTPPYQKHITSKIQKFLARNGILVSDESEKDLISHHTGWTSNSITLPIFLNSHKESV
jgi:chemotaxis protein methyltransferase CheR